MIDKARKHLKNDETWQKVCQEWGESPDIIDLMPIRFGNIDVSAKTDHGVITLNWRLLCDGNFTKDYSYLIHEGTHWLQQTCSDKPTKGADDGDYLSNPHEQEGFQTQVEYIANTEGDDKAEAYVDDLLEHHDKTGPKAEKLKDVLMEKVESHPISYLYTKYGQ